MPENQNNLTPITPANKSSTRKRCSARECGEWLPEWAPGQRKFCDRHAVKPRRTPAYPARPCAATGCDTTLPPTPIGRPGRPRRFCEQHTTSKDSGAGIRGHAVYLRDRAQAIKRDRGCADCGYNAHAEALHYDHRPEFVKREAISRLVARAGTSWETIVAEIMKCDVVCANCHAVRTAERRKCPSHRVTSPASLPAIPAWPA